MLIVLPPSEGKTEPEAGPPLELDTLVAPELGRVREQLLATTIRLCSGRWQRAAEVLGLGPTQGELIARNAELRTAPTARADTVYTGVLFENLEPATVPTAALDSTVLISSALFGLVRPGDAIPAYRLSAGTSLPRLGTVAGRWKPVLPRAIERLAGDGLVVDLRSGAYVGLGKPPSTVETASIRVLHERDGKRSVVSHFNKATKGRIVRQVLREGVQVDTIPAFADALRDLGWTVELEGRRLDVVVAEV